MNSCELILFVKDPIPGKVKTRLLPKLTSDEAANLYKKWARQTLQISSSLKDILIQVAYASSSKNQAPLWIWAPGEPVSFFKQEGVDLGERMKHAFQRAFKAGRGKVVIIGTDSPGLPMEYLQDAFSSLDKSDLVLGPTTDGGYYLIGVANNFPETLFNQIQWSTGSVFEKTKKNAQQHHLKIHELPKYFDVDEPEDLAKLKKISIIIPVLNEAALLEKSIKTLKKQSKGEAIEIIVSDGGSTDKTLEKARHLADHVVSTGEPNRGAQMHKGALRASGELLIFLHVDTMLPSDWHSTIRHAFDENKSRPAAAVFRLGFDSEKFAYRVITKLASIRTLITGVPHGDQGLVVERNVYFESGGFPEAPLMEEYFLLPRLRKLGKIKILESAVKTASRKYEKKGPFRNAFSNFLTVCLFYIGVSPKTLAKRYRAG